ncbi:MAG: hypothetical protein WCO02_04010 [Bacteroidota bacterium]
MPLILGRNRPNGAIGVWQITEDETALSTLASAVEEDEKVVRTFKNESRRKQWYACRALLRQMLSFDEVKVDYDMHGRPSLRGFKGDISFSHTQDYAAVILNKVGRAGIDIEKINPRIHRVADRFLQDEELEHVSRIARNEERGTCHQSPTNSNQQPTTNPQPPIPNPQPPIPNPQSPTTELLYLYWCAKEALYKFYGNPSVDLKNDIYIIAFDYFCNPNAAFTSRVKSSEGIREHELLSVRIGDHMLVYTL